MSDVPDLSEHLLTLPNIKVKKKLFLFNETIYEPTGEKIVEGFRYFSCPVEDLLSAFSRQDFKAISELPFAVDEDGDADTSAVRLDLVYTESGALVGAQPVEYQDYNPTPVATPLVLEGAAAQRLIGLIRELDVSE